MSSQRSTRSVSGLRVGDGVGLERRYDAQGDALPRLQRLGERVEVVGGRGPPRSRAQPAGTGAAEQLPRHAGRAGVDPRLRARAAASTHSSAADASGGWTTRCRPKPGRGRDRARQHGRQRRLVDLYDDPLGATRRRTSARCVATPSASAWASSRRAPWSESTLSPRGFSTVAASVHGPATWTLNDAAEVLRLLLERVEVLGEQRPGAAVVDAGAVGEPPAGRLEVEAEVGDHGERPADHRRRRRRGRAARAGRAGRAASPSTTRTASAYVLGVVAGPRPDAGRDASRGHADAGGGDDRGRADDAGAVVDHRGLARGDALGGVEQLDLDVPSVEPVDTATAARCSAPWARSWTVAVARRRRARRRTSAAGRRRSGRRSAPRAARR